MKRGACVTLLCLLWTSLALAAVPRVAVLTGGNTDREAVRYLRGELGMDAVEVEEAPEPTADLLRRAREEQWASHLVLLDAARRRVLVVRVADGAAWERTLAPETFSYTALAVVAAELVEVAFRLPESAQRRVVTRVPERRRAFTIAGSAGAAASFVPRGDAGLLRGFISTDLSLAPPDSGLGVLMSTFVALPWAAEWGEAGGETLHYQRTDVGLGALADVRLGRLRVLGGAVGGVGFAVVRATEDRVDVGGASHRVWWVGVHGEVRFQAWRGLFLAAGVEGLVVPSPGRYLFRGEPRLREGPWQLGATGSVGWETGH